MRREWDLDDLIASWTLVDADEELLARLHAGSRLSFALMVKFFEIEGRFPRHPGELPQAAVDFVARQLGVPADAGFEVTGGRWSGSGCRSARCWGSGCSPAATRTR